MLTLNLFNRLKRKTSFQTTKNFKLPPNLDFFWFGNLPPNQGSGLLQIITSISFESSQQYWFADFHVKSVAALF